MIYERKASVWVVRRDGWMRRMDFALPLQSIFKMSEPIDLLSAKSIDEALVSEPRYTDRTFQLMSVEHWELMPWAEPCFYREL